MGQDDIVQFLKKNKHKWFCVRDISKYTGSSCTSVNRCLGQLKKYYEIRCKVVKVKHTFHFGNVPFYSYKDDDLSDERS